MRRAREVARLLTTDASVFWRALAGPVAAIAITSGVAREWPPSAPTVRTSAAILEVAAIFVLFLGVEHALRTYGKLTIAERLWAWWGRALGCVPPRVVSVKAQSAATITDSPLLGLGGSLEDCAGTEAKLRFLERKISFLETDVAALKKRHDDNVADIRRELRHKIAETRALVEKTRSQGADATLGDFGWQLAALVWLAAAAVLPVVPLERLPSVPMPAVAVASLGAAVTIIAWVGYLPAPNVGEGG